MSRKKSKYLRGSNRQTQIDAILASLAGERNYNFDHLRSDEKLLAPRTLSVSANRELFNHLAARDYLYLKNLPILAAAQILPLLLPQSVWGRAQNGHGMFCDDQGRALTFPDATIEDVILGLGSEELGMQNRLVKIQRQKLLENFEYFLLSSLGKERIVFGSVGDEDDCPFGISFLEGVSVDAHAFFKGFVLGGLMDNWKDRRRTVKHFSVTLRGEPLILGGGESLLVNRERFFQVGLNEQLAADKIFTNQELGKLRELEVIVPEEANRKRPKPVGTFFRRMAGPGVSDDAAIVYIGKTYGVDAMFGVLLADAADTYDKFVDTYCEGGYDEKLVWMISNRLKTDQKLVTEEEIRRMIYFSAKANYPPLDISSSHR
ncbi:MAG TPA: hypothetical protein VM123_01405, partial [archaeon]|nr:hypothetical protein [archaeon]